MILLLLTSRAEDQTGGLIALSACLSGDLPKLLLDGRETDEPAMHPTAVIATTAAGSLATDNPRQERWVKFFWETPLRTGGRRYYDNCLYFFCLLMLSGMYRIY